MPQEFQSFAKLLLIFLSIVNFIQIHTDLNVYLLNVLNVVYVHFFHSSGYANVNKVHTPVSTFTEEVWNAIAVLFDSIYYVLWVCHYMPWFRHYMLWFRHYMPWVCYYMLWFRHYIPCVCHNMLWFRHYTLFLYDNSSLL